MNYPERKTAKQLVSDGTPHNFKRQWFHKLDSEDQAYVRKVVQEISQNPEASFQLVARNLAVELSIKPSEVQSIATTLEEMTRDLKATK